MKYSVIIPVYNTDVLHFQKCIKSIKQQPFEDYEVIIVNDGSKDELSDKYKAIVGNDDRFKLYMVQNKGVSCARNFGIEKSCGEYIIFLDSDDWIESDTFGKIAIELNNYDLILFSYYENNDTNETHREYYTDNVLDLTGLGKYDLIRRLTSKYLCSYQLKNNSMTDSTIGTSWAKVFRRELLQKHECRFPEEMSFAEDIVFNRFCLYCADTVKYINLPYYHYRIVENSLSHKRTTGQQAIDRKKRVVDELERFISSLPYSADLMLGLYYNKIELFKLYLYFTAQSPRDAKNYFELLFDKKDMYYFNKEYMPYAGKDIFFIKHRLFTILYCNFVIRRSLANIKHIFQKH